MAVQVAVTVAMAMGPRVAREGAAAELEVATAAATAAAVVREAVRCGSPSGTR
tara:strand:+ start:5486 stop:5644 length:159 start_codon:yes stop_codon:yes gene_type:complete